METSNDWSEQKKLKRQGKINPTKPFFSVQKKDCFEVRL